MKFYTFSIKFLRLIYLLLGLYFLCNVPGVLWYYPLLGYLFVACCNGVASHRYFVHDQFCVNKAGRCVLAFLSTVGMYSPINYWIVQHKHHHRSSDKSNDVHSPTSGILHASLLWPFKQQSIESVFKEKSALLLMARANKDPVISFFSNNFIAINLLWILVLSVIDQNLVLYFYLPGVLLDYLRVGLINSVCHLPSIPGNYRNYETNDNSQNNILIGLITLGFGWHNNHHNDAGKLLLTEKWWELDIEGYIGKLFSILFKPLNT